MDSFCRRFQICRSGLKVASPPHGCKSYTCFGRRVGEVSIDLHLLLTFLSCVMGVHMCSPPALDGAAGIGAL